MIKQAKVNTVFVERSYPSQADELLGSEQGNGWVYLYFKKEKKSSQDVSLETVSLKKKKK